MPLTGNGQYTGEAPGGSMPGGDNAGLIGAVIQAGAGLYDSHQNRKTSRENTDKTIAANKREAELAYQREVEMMNAMNSYNSPAAQMARFSAAGLNPHLIYGQGSTGNQQGFAKYQPADMQHRYEAGQIAPALTGILPTLMAVGSWMQNMRLSEASLDKTQVDTARSATETERARQLIDYLMQKNPIDLKNQENKLSIFPYQKQTADYQSNIARTKLFELEQDFRNKYGEGLFNDMGSAWSPSGGKFSGIGGMKKLQFLQEQSKTKLLDAKASWTNMDITDPQAIMMMVLNGVMGLAGSTIRMTGNRASRRSKVTHETESTMRGGRKTTRRRIYEK